MATFNTGNPIGSAELLDLYDNAESLDIAVNSDDLTFTDRIGTERLTLKGYGEAAKTAGEDIAIELNNKNSLMFWEGF